MLKIDPYEPHVPIYARCAAPFWYWTITRITGVHCAANAPSWERQQRRISEIETIPTFDAKCSKMRYERGIAIGAPRVKRCCLAAFV